MEDVQAGHEILDLVEIAQGQPFEQRALELQRPQFVGCGGVSVRKTQAAVGKSRRDGRFLAGRDDADRAAGAEVDRDERVRAGSQPQARSRARELDDECASFDRCYASDAQLAIGPVRQVVPWPPRTCPPLIHVPQRLTRESP